MTQQVETIQYDYVAKDELSAPTLALIKILEQLDSTVKALAVSFKDEGAAADDAGDKLKDHSDETAKSADESAKLSEVLGSKLTQSFAAAGVVAAAYTAGLVKLYGITTDLTAAGEEQSRLDQQLADTISRNTKSRAEAEAQYKRLNALIGDFADSTGLSDEALSESLDTIINQTGKLNLTQKDLTLVQGLAAQGHKEVTEAAADYAKLLKGDLGVLEEYTNLTKGQLEGLEAIPGEANRVAKAQEMLLKQYGQTTQGAESASQAQAKLSGAYGDLQQKIGQAINASGALQAILGPVTQAIKEQEANAGKNSDALQSIALTVADKVVFSFRFLLEVGREVVGFWHNLQVGVKGVGVQLDVWSAGASVAFAEVKAGIIELAEAALDPLFDRFDTLLEYGERLAELSGIDALQRGFERASDELEGLREGLGDLGASAYDDVIKAQKEYNATVSEGEKQIKDLLISFGATDDVINKIDDVIKQMEQRLAQARASKRAALEPEIGRNQGAATSGRDVANEQERAAAIEARRLKIEQEQATLELQKIAAQREGNDLLIAQLEYKQAILQAEADTAEIKNKQLRSLQQQAAQEQAALDYAEKRASLITEEVDKIAEANAERANQQALRLQIAALQSQDDLHKGLLELEAERLRIEHAGLDPLERQLELLKLQKQETDLISGAEAERFDRWSGALSALSFDGSIFDAGAAASLNQQIEFNNALLDEQTAALEAQQAPREQIAALQERIAGENEQLQRNIELQQARNAALVQAASSAAQLSGALVALAKSQWDFAKAQESSLAGLSAGVSLAGGLADALITSQKKRAAVMSVVNGAAALGAYALFAETLLPNYLTAGLNYTASAVQYGLVAGSSPSATSAPSVSAGGAPARFSDAPSLNAEVAADTTDRTARAIAEAIARSNSATSDRSMTIDLRGATLMSDDPRAWQVLSSGLKGFVSDIIKDELKD